MGGGYMIYSCKANALMGLISEDTGKGKADMTIVCNTRATSSERGQKCTLPDV